MNNFEVGFEKAASISGFVNKLRSTVSGKKITGDSTFIGRTRNFLNTNRKKAFVGMSAMALPALAIGGYKAIDSQIGTPTPVNEW